MQVTAAVNCSDSQLVASSFVNMSSPVWKFFSVAEEDNAIAICNQVNTTNLISHLKGRHRGEAVLRDLSSLNYWNSNGIPTSYYVGAISVTSTVTVTSNNHPSSSHRRPEMQH